MARRGRRVDSPWTGDGRDAALDGLFSEMRDAARSALGREDISVGLESEHGHVGLPLPGLCLRYLFRSTTFPLSRILQVTGEEGSAKSAFLYEIFRWHMVYGGGAVLCENENKDSPELRHSILQWNPSWIQRCEKIPTYNLEDWQDAFTRFVDIARDQQEAVGGPGRTIPICFGVDSIMGTSPREEIDAIRKSGHAERSFALAANLITRYMRTMPERLKSYPFTVVGTNHLKPGMTMQGLPTSTIPGGKSVKFHETFEIEMSKTFNKDIDTLEYGGLRLKFVCKKNSIGPSRMAIQAELLWWYQDDPATGEYRQQTAWDWDTASIEFLLSFENAKGKRTVFNRLQEICDINVGNRSNRMAWSQALSVPRDDPQHYRVLGAALERRPDLLVPIYRVLGIMPRRPFQPGVDYQELLRTAQDNATEVERALYQNVGAPQLAADAIGPVTTVDPEAPEVPTEPEEDTPAAPAPSRVGRRPRGGQ